MSSERSEATAIAEIKPGSFIYEIPDALSAAQCSYMIERFEANPEQQYAGRIGQGESEQASIKKSSDLRISGREDWHDIDKLLLSSLGDALNHLSAIHPYFASNSFKDMGYNLQRTKAGEYYHWHIDSGPGQFSQRQLVAIWYLNDVKEDGGETEFYFQNVSVRPQAGKLVLFPPFWTHVHRGKTLTEGVKYIATTWICFS
ncbi:MAG: 2OG-Fe(II) oxygenase [Gammaproteobacteria bacterium]|nr:2OG-Fe(II) oxygenase [Gammaproteobacteria bacterium]